MLKQKVQYEDFDGATQVETLYFNLNRVELISLHSLYGTQAMAPYIDKLVEDTHIEKLY